MRDGATAVTQRITKNLAPLNDDGRDVHTGRACTFHGLHLHDRRNVTIGRRCPSSKRRGTRWGARVGWEGILAPIQQWAALYQE